MDQEETENYELSSYLLSNGWQTPEGMRALPLNSDLDNEQWGATGLASWEQKIEQPKDLRFYVMKTWLILYLDACWKSYSFCRNYILWITNSHWSIGQKWKV